MSRVPWGWRFRAYHCGPMKGMRSPIYIAPAKTQSLMIAFLMIAHHGGHH
ncbi:hypothetical protein [Streptomyces sp. UNOC14_S4]|nr:hypothetical protein [Streptomyces sp. UNOC14_S4]MCC3766283.1 hypothetical protein [Streptomyces sp. UNOC14_S4]